MSNRSLMKLTVVRALIASALFAAIADRALAVESLRESLSGAAVQIKKVLELEKSDSIALGLFVPRNGDNNASYGRRISESLRAELEHADVNVLPKAELRLKGEYILDDESGTVSIFINVVDSAGKIVNSIASGRLDAKSLTAENRDAREILFVSHASVVVQRTDSLRDISQAAASENNDSRALSIDDGYLWFKDLGLGLRLREVDTSQKSSSPDFLKSVVPAVSVSPPHFELSESKSYVIDLKNTRTNIDFAAEVLFDGISTFELCDEAEKTLDHVGRLTPRFQFWKIARETAHVIPGWYKNLEKVSAFQIVPDAKSVAHRLGRTEGIGTIQVIVRAAWPKGEAVPDEFRANRAKGGVREGETIEVDLKPEELETGVILGSLSAEYEVKK